MRTVMSKDGTAIAFDQSGQGPALILVASASATRKDQASLAAALALHFTVVAYDRRGRGESGDTAGCRGAPHSPGLVGSAGRGGRVLHDTAGPSG